MCSKLIRPQGQRKIEARAAGLETGRHAYKFLLDGERWLVDPANSTRIADGYGGWNSLLQIPPGSR